MPFLVGPLAIAPEAWPPSWLVAAESSFPAVSHADAEARGGAFTVRCDLTGLRPEEEGIAARAEELMLQNRDGALWQVVSPGMFSATLYLESRTFVVRSADPDIEPELALNNPLRALLATVLPLQHDGLIIHGCSGVLRGEGLLVAGVSTAGKTTLALGFQETRYITDDVSIVTTGERPQLLASPFFGGAGKRGEDISGPLRAIGVLVGKELDPSKRSSFTPTTKVEGCAALLRHVARYTKDRELSALLLELTARLVEHVPVVLIRRSLHDASDEVAERLLHVARSA